MITTGVELKKGEYALYLARGEGMAAYVYDFRVQGAHRAQALEGSKPRPAANVSELTRHSDPAAVDALASPAQPPKPVVARQISSAAAGSVPASVPAGVTGTSQGGVLGLSGEDWEQGGVRGVEIMEVADDSSSQLAGLRKGYVITDVNGVHVRSAQELGSLLAQMDPGTRVSIGYLFKSNLGWMPQETVAILGK
jgi:membrane-associated protease RseP (regulator of RpoE activity)